MHLRQKRKQNLLVTLPHKDKHNICGICISNFFPIHMYIHIYNTYIHIHKCIQRFSKMNFVILLYNLFYQLRMSQEHLEGKNKQ
jgi:hypothetical protein